MTAHSTPVIQFKRTRDHDLPVPARESEAAAGFDLRCLHEGVALPPGNRMLISTGWSCAIPHGWCGQIWARSGMSLTQGSMVMAGMIDSDYRGELKVLIYNGGRETLSMKRGDRIAQLVVTPCLLAETMEVPELRETARGDGGFGSTGRD